MVIALTDSLAIRPYRPSLLAGQLDCIQCPLEVFSGVFICGSL